MKLMILGASGAQLQGIKKAKTMGLEVVTCDYLPHAIGHAFSDARSYVSTFDAEGIIEAASIMAVDGIMTMGTDQPVLTVAQASEALGLPCFHSVDVARSVTHKAVMKDLFRNNGLPTTDYGFFKPGREHILSHLAFPVVMKPVDSQGQRGVFYIEDREGVFNHFHESVAYSREDYVLIESYYANDEITVSGWVDEGKCTVLSIADRITFDSKDQIGICLAHRVPSKHQAAYGEELIAMTKKIVDVFCIENGPIYFQYFIGDRGLMINEIACRIGGAYEGVFIPVISGFDMVENVIKGCLGLLVETDGLASYDCMKQRAHVSVQLFFSDTCEIDRLPNLDEILAIEGVLDAGLNYCVGDRVGRIENATARAGYFVVTAKSESELEELVEVVFEKMTIIGTDGKNHVIRAYA